MSDNDRPAGKPTIREALDYALRFLACEHSERAPEPQICPRCKAVAALHADESGDGGAAPS